jgi:predicted membrane chloride channel (bestrophin family)
MTSVGRIFSHPSTPRIFRQAIFYYSVAFAIPAGIFTVILRERFPDAVERLSIHSSASSNLSMLISVFVAFRASQAYARFWDGTTALFRLRGHFFDVVSSLFAFSRLSRAPQEDVAHFRHTSVRLFSILETLLLADLANEGELVGSELAFDYSIIDPAYFDEETLAALKTAKFPIEMLVQWIQSLIVEAMDSGVLAVPAPICTRSFQELQAGIAWFHVARRITQTPIPFPYTFATHFVLAMNWLVMPFAANSWSNSSWISGALATIQVLAMFVLNGVSKEMENPFGCDENDLNVEDGHVDFNNMLWAMLTPQMQMMPKRAENVDVHSVTMRMCCEKEHAPYTLRHIFGERVERQDQKIRHSSRASTSPQSAQHAEPPSLFPAVNGHDNFCPQSTADKPPVRSCIVPVTTKSIVADARMFGDTHGFGTANPEEGVPNERSLPHEAAPSHEVGCASVGHVDVPLDTCCATESEGDVSAMLESGPIIPTERH